ncbi:hypothetical protein [Amycolatopsis sp. NPDC006125]|uniref:helix-turn-helix domain-containing protein n=1 Tax=Amycolatopsis sp. NPDC006125 TaxID=3156730 RepID=UPI0033AFA08B
MATRRSSVPKHPPNGQLTWHRVQRGWSCDELAKQLRRSVSEAGDGTPGVNGDVVRRWESGDRRPDPLYKKHLVLVFGKPAAELGLLTPEEMALRPSRERSANVDDPVDRRLVGELVKRVMLEMMGGGPQFGRELFLKGVFGMSLAPLAASGREIPDSIETLAEGRGSRLDPRMVDAYSAVTASHRQMYWDSSASDLLPSVVAHAGLGVRKLQTVSDVEVPGARQLAAAVAEEALIAARLTFFDLADTVRAEQFFDTAENAAKASRDHALVAAVLAHRAFVPGFAQDEQGAQQYLDEAYAHLPRGAGPLLRSWLHCVGAEVSARTGQVQASLGHVRAAEDALVSDGSDPTWLDYFDSSRLDGFAGNALLLAGQHRAAADRLEAALSDAADTSDKQRGVLLFDLASAQASFDAESAAATARQACDQAMATRYGMATQRAVEVRNALSATRYVAELDERLNALEIASASEA